MRYSLLILLIVLLGSCDVQTSGTVTKTKERKLELFCDNFIVSHRNWQQNDIINEAANKDLEKALSVNISTGLLSDFPMELYLINEYQKGKYAAHFSTDHFVKTRYTFNFDVIALISENDIATLKTDSLYGVDGHFKKFLNEDFKDYSYGLAYSPKVHITKDDIYEDSVDFDLGIILMDSLKIKRLHY